MNILQAQEALKDMSERQLVQEAKSPSGMVPSYMVIGELKRRQDMKDRYMMNQGKPQMTVADSVVSRQMQETMPPQMMPQQSAIAPNQPRRMFMGGLARLLGSATRGTTRTPVAGSGTRIGSQIAPQSGGTNLPMAPINPSQLPVPYVPPTTMQRGLGALKGFGRTLLGATPFGLGAYAMTGGEGLGDGTMAGRFGLSDEEYELLVAEAEKRGITPYDERFADFAQAVVDSRGEADAGIRAAAEESLMGEQEKARAEERGIMDILKAREERAKQMALAQFGVSLAKAGSEGKDLLTAASEAGEKALPVYAKGADMKDKFQMDLFLAKAKKSNNLTDLVKYRAEIGKQLQNISLPPAEREQLMLALSTLDARIQMLIGISGAQQAGIPSVEAVKAEIQKRKT